MKLSELDPASLFRRDVLDDEEEGLFIKLSCLPHQAPWNAVSMTTGNLIEIPANEEIYPRSPQEDCDE